MNPESKQINRDIIRSHNEVMLVIGVAEPENGLSESQAETARRHHQYEDDTGHTLLRVSRLVEAAGAWGVTGARHRILVCNSLSNKYSPEVTHMLQLYKRYAHVPFYQLLQYERSQRSLATHLFAGFPSFLMKNCLKIYCPSSWVEGSLL